MQLTESKSEKGVLETCQKNISSSIDRWTANLSPEKCILSGCENHKMREVLGNNDLYVSLKTFQASDTSSFHNSSHIFLQFHVTKLAG